MFIGFCDDDGGFVFDGFPVGNVLKSDYKLANSSLIMGVSVWIMVVAEELVIFSGLGSSFSMDSASESSSKSDRKLVDSS